jgi:hypothetical protein
VTAMADDTPRPAGPASEPGDAPPPPVPAARPGDAPAPSASSVVPAPESAAAAAEPPARGFPGFPAGDPRQLPLSQRPRGLDAPPVPGGRDPELRETLVRERPYVRLLVGMVAVIVGGSLLLTFLAIISAAVLR